MGETVSHADLHRDIGALQADMKNVKDDVKEIKSNGEKREAKVDGQFAAVNGKLDTLLAEREQRKGMKTLAISLYTIGGSGVTLLAQWALKKLGGL